MALYKIIRQDDGVETSYHRILFLMKTVNRQNSIAVLSYINDKSRRDDQAGENQPYRRSITYETDYDEDMTIEGAYKYLKSLPVFEGAEDI